VNDAATSTPVRCEFCGQLVVVRQLPDHRKDCREREHPTQERFE
jgi:hypothetical protein